MLVQGVFVWVLGRRCVCRWRVGGAGGEVGGG